MYGYDLGPQDWLLMLGIMALMTVLTVAAVIAAVRAARRGRTDASARDLHDERYARGQLSSQEYQERKQQLAQQ